MNGIKFPSGRPVPQAGTGRSDREMPGPSVRPASVRRTFDEMRNAHPKLTRLFTDAAASADRFRGKFSTGSFTQATGAHRAESQMPPDYRRQARQQFPTSNTYQAYQPYQSSPFNGSKPFGQAYETIQTFGQKVERYILDGLDRLIGKLENMRRPSHRYGFPQQPAGFAGQHGWHAPSNQQPFRSQYMPYQNHFQHNPFQQPYQHHGAHYGHPAGNANASPQSWQQPYERDPRFFFNTQPMHAQQPPFQVPPQQPAVTRPPAINIGVQRSAEEWKTTVAELQKHGMTKTEMAQWNKDFSHYINHGNSDAGVKFNQKYARIIDGDINDSAVRSNYVRLHKALMKTLAQPPA